MEQQWSYDLRAFLETSAAFPIFLSVIAILFCVTLILGTCSGRTKASSPAVSSGCRHDSAVTPRLSRAHPRNIYQRAIHDGSTRYPGPRPQSVFNNGRRAMQGRIDFEAKVRRKAASNSPMYMCMRACVPMDINPWTWSCLERTRLGMLAYRARNLYQCMENEIPKSRR